MNEDDKKVEEVLDTLDTGHINRNRCKKCGSTETVMKNYSMMWHEGDIYCAKCGEYIRMFDAG